jgi:hypothetical protein
VYWLSGLHIYTPLPFRPGKGGFGDLFRTHLFVTAGNLQNIVPGMFDLISFAYRACSTILCSKSSKICENAVNIQHVGITDVTNRKQPCQRPAGVTCADGACQLWPGHCHGTGWHGSSGTQLLLALQISGGRQVRHVLVRSFIFSVNLEPKINFKRKLFVHRINPGFQFGVGMTFQ